MVASFVEYFVELLLFPSLKSFSLPLYVGIIITAVGQIGRIVALHTARANFTHQIAEVKQEKHVLVTSGIYQLSRHPGYAGWFWWSVGTQVVMFNPLCIAAYAYTSWMFFKARIAYEEELLIKFFGDDYEKFKKSTRTLIPFIP
eukprot:TRINITY_DN2643_c0_g1_i4.p1 TRINITY_DN2643_c0_g1~~TRINITY_DN2643_c0_g1_i4.p1  ORF type:complete len:144 (-),score=28.04 TRINITY_DN2643_c0_g1_i4:4-435(-)